MLFLMKKRLIYPFTFEDWMKHPSTKPKLKWIKSVCAEMILNKKHGKQLKIELI